MKGIPMLRFDPDASVAAAAASNDVQQKDAADDGENTFVRWAPVFVPLTGGCLLLMAFVIWSVVL